MAICFGRADINSVLTLLMNPPPATNLYANCHGNSGISHIFLFLVQLWSTAAIYNTWRKILLCGSICHPDTAVLELQASVVSMQLWMSLYLLKISCKYKLYKINATVKSWSIASSGSYFTHMVCCSSVLDVPWILWHMTIGIGEASPLPSLVDLISSASIDHLSSHKLQGMSVLLSSPKLKRFFCSLIQDYRWRKKKKV